MCGKFKSAQELCFPAPYDDDRVWFGRVKMGCSESNLEGAVMLCVLYMCRLSSWSLYVWGKVCVRFVT